MHCALREMVEAGGKAMRILMWCALGYIGQCIYPSCEIRFLKTVHLLLICGFKSGCNDAETEGLSYSDGVVREGRQISLSWRLLVLVAFCDDEKPLLKF